MEQKNTLKSCVNAKEVYAFLTENGVKISKDDAEKIFALLKTEPISDEKLKSVTGGEGDNGKNEETQEPSKLKFR